MRPPTGPNRGVLIVTFSQATVRYPRSSESLDPFRRFRAGAKATEAKTLSDEGFRTATAEV